MVGVAPVRRLLGRLHDLWETWLLLRWAAGLLGGAAAMAGGFWTWVCVRFARARVELATDAPEYASDLTLKDVTPRLAWPGPSRIPWTPIVIGLVILLTLVLLVRMPLPKPDNPWAKDPQREFTAADQAWICAAVGDRCEHYTLGLFRCRRKVEHKDHWYPHAKGGATDRHNLVGLCAKHNIRKSDHIPTVLDTWLLYRHRLAYLPARLRGYAWPDGVKHE